MSQRLAAVTGLLLLTSPLLAQPNSGVYTNATIPSARDLERLNLNVAWKSYVPMDNRADGIASLQLIDGQLYVQTRTNLLIVFNEVNGDEVWRFTLPKRDLPVFPLAVNRTLVLIVNGPKLYILDRSNGKLKYTTDLPSTVCGGLAADLHQCFIVLSNNKVIGVGLNPEDVRIGQRVRPRIERPDAPTGVTMAKQTASPLTTVANSSPGLTLLQSLRSPFTYNGKDVTPSLVASETLHPPYRLDSNNRTPSLQMMNSLRTVAEATDINAEDTPRIMWELQSNRRVEATPEMYDSYIDHFLILAGTDHSVFVCDKYAEKQNVVRHEYLADRELSAPIARYGPELYFCVADGNVYWVHIENFRNSDIPVKQVKRFLAGLAIDRKPLITDDSIYLTGSQSGLTRLDRKTFEKVWTNSEVDRVYAVNPNVVYAGDRRGNLLVLDRARGLKLTSLDIRSFNYPILNEQDDRLLLAGNNGLILCLHDRSFRRAAPLRPKEPKPFVDPLDELKDQEPKKNIEPKKEAEPKKEVAPKKEAEPKKEVEPKKEAEPKKEVEPKKEAEPKMS